MVNSNGDPDLRDDPRPDRPMDELVRFDIIPSFEDSVSIRLLGTQGRESGEYRLDCEIVGVRRPKAWQVQLPQREAEKLVAELDSARLVRPKNVATGLDGTRYVLRSGLGAGRVSLRWWDKLPHEWVRLRTPLERLIRLIGPHLSHNVRVAIR